MNVRVRAGLVGLALVVGGSALAGCASPRDALGPTESACYQAIPPARAAAPGDATFAGVRYLSLGRLEHAITGSQPALASTLALPVPATTATCIVAFSGRFSATLDRHASGVRRGSYLLVIVALRASRPLASLVVAREPFRLVRVLPASH